MSTNHGDDASSRREQDMSTESTGCSRPVVRSFRTRAIHVGNEVDAMTGAVVPPIHMATTFQQPGAGKWGAFDYSRSGNPTRSHLQATLASLEGGCGALAFSSGMAAIHCVTMMLRQGDHVVAGCDLYGGAYRLLHKICNRSGVDVTLVDMTDTAAVDAAINDRTRLVWAETIGNPRLTIPDLAQLAEIAHARGVRIGVDNTFGTPALLRPLEHGIDIVMHSATKYLGGHSDCLGGTLAVADSELLEELYFIQNATGGVLDPMSSFLVARGLIPQVESLDRRRPVAWTHAGGRGPPARAARAYSALIRMDRPRKHRSDAA